MMENKTDSLAYVLTYIVMSLVLGWLLNCAWLWLASKCFGVEFSVKTATGIWLVLHAVKSIFAKTKEGK